MSRSETGCSRRLPPLRTQLAPVPRRVTRAAPQRSRQRPAPAAAALRSRRHGIGAGGTTPPQRGQGPAQRGPGRGRRALRAVGTEGAGEARIAAGPAGAEAAGGSPDALDQRGSGGGAGAQKRHVPRAARARRLPRAHGPAEPSARACAECRTAQNHARPHPARHSTAPPPSPPHPALTPRPTASTALIGPRRAGPAPPQGERRDAAGAPDPGSPSRVPPPSTAPAISGHPPIPGTPCYTDPTARALSLALTGVLSRARPWMQVCADVRRCLHAHLEHTCTHSCVSVCPCAVRAEPCVCPAQAVAMSLLKCPLCAVRTQSTVLSSPCRSCPWPRITPV